MRTIGANDHNGEEGEVTLQLASIPSRGRSNIHSRSMLQKHELTVSLMGHLRSFKDTILSNCRKTIITMAKNNKKMAKKEVKFTFSLIKYLIFSSTDFNIPVN